MGFPLAEAGIADFGASAAMEYPAVTKAPMLTSA
jgi:hypothetical protein